MTRKQKNLWDVGHESIAVLTTTGLKRCILASRKTTNQQNTLINEQCGFKAKPADEKHSWIQRDLANVLFKRKIASSFSLLSVFSIIYNIVIMVYSN